MSNPSSERKLKNLIAGTATETVQPLSFVAADRIKDAVHAKFDPTSGALIISPDLDLKIRKALTRAARQIALRQQLCLPILYFRYLALEVRRVVLLMQRKAAGYVSYFALNRGHRNISRSMGRILPYGEDSVKSGIIAHVYLLPLVL
jgi:hypothetical protein